LFISFFLCKLCQGYHGHPGGKEVRTPMELELTGLKLLGGSGEVYSPESHRAALDPKVSML